MVDEGQRVTICNFLPRQKIDEDRKKILRGLTSPMKYIPSIFFYDEIGSELYEKITRLQEYYLPKIEIPLLKKIGCHLKNELKNVDIVELGSGDCSKISILLEYIPQNLRETVRYLPFDVSQEAIEKSSKILSKKFPHIQIQGIVADFQTQLTLIPKDRKRIFCFLGSTIGNFSKKQTKEFMADLSNTMEPGDMLLLSVDMVKDKDILEKAYNDTENVTATFNFNILHVVNRYAKTNFNSRDFEHVAFFNEAYSRIEMHLKAKKDVKISSPYLDKNITLKKGETIHTENSHKFTYESIKNLALAGQLEIQNIFTDKNKWFSVIQLIK